MIPPTSATTALTTPAPVELSEQEVAQLRRTAGWARLVAIIGLVLYGLIALMSFAVQITNRAGELASLTFALSLTIAILGGVVAATMVLGYAQNVLSFFRHGAPALAQAFRRLKLFFMLWTLVGAFDILFELVWLLGKR